MNDLLGPDSEDFPAGASPLDGVVEPGRQRAFLGGQRWPIACTGCSATVMSRQLRRLAGTEAYEFLLEFLAHYVALVVPDPVMTEGSFWAVETVSDCDVAVGDPQPLVRLRVHGVAVATVVEDPEGDGEEPLVCLALAPVPVVDRVYSPQPCYLDVDGTPVSAQHAEAPAGEMGGRLLADPDLLSTARRAVVALMRMGPTGGDRHERDLADALFTAIAATEGLAHPHAHV
ncbi:hypothetical protein ACFYE2_14970 [Kocuria sp. CPCC 205300]|uniref:hypothetical protein n=1 Tax=Kocuria sabuli TaxID=3071448 RepID=UPI0036DB062B